jgi:hypothetical protein
LRFRDVKLSNVYGGGAYESIKVRFSDECHEANAKKIGVIHVSHGMSRAFCFSCIRARIEKLLLRAIGPLKPNAFRNAQHVLLMFPWLRLDLDCLYAERAFTWEQVVAPSRDSDRDVLLGDR